MPTGSTNAGPRSLLGQCREMVVRLGKTESALIRSLQQDRLLAERVETIRRILNQKKVKASTLAKVVIEVAKRMVRGVLVGRFE